MPDDPTRAEHLAAVLTGSEVLLARTAVRKTLAKLRANYRNDLRRGGSRDHFADTRLRKFDDYLDLYELLGGDPDDVTDPQDNLRAALAGGASGAAEEADE